MLSRFIHVVAWVRISLLFKAECHCPEGAHLADPSPASGHLGCLRLLAPVDNAAGSVTVQMSHSRPYLLYSRIDTEVELRLVILHKISRGGATLSSTAAAPFHTPTDGREGSDSSTSSPALAFRSPSRCVAPLHHTDHLSCCIHAHLSRLPPPDPQRGVKPLGHRAFITVPPGARPQPGTKKVLNEAIKT